MTIRVLLADDHALVREGLRSLLSDEADMEVVGEAEDGRSTVRLAAELTPDVVIMDVTMPDLNGIGATRKIMRKASGVRVLALSVHSDSRFVVRMIEAGASGYVPKGCSFEELCAAIRAVANGQTYLSPLIAGDVVRDYARRLSQSSSSEETGLTPREREVLQLLAEGKAAKEVGALLGVSTKTVSSHRRRMMVKLGIHSLAGLVRYAIRQGIASLER